MTWSAPARAARWPFSGLLTVVMTVASDHRASWIAALPTAPAPPATRTVRPSSVPGPSRVGPSSVTVRHRCAVRNGTPRLAPRSNDATSGSSTTCRAGTTAYSCAVPPAGRRWAASQIQTRRPEQRRLDALPDGVDHAGAVLVRHLRRVDGGARPRCRDATSSRSG